MTLPKLGYSCTKIGSGKTPLGGAEVYVSEGITFLRSQNVHNDGLRLDDVVKIEPAVDAEMAISRVKPGDVLFNITGASIGRCCLVPESLGPANVNQHVCIIRPTDARYGPYFAYALQSPELQSQISASLTGAARDGVTFEQLSNLRFALPTPAQAQSTAAFLDSETAEIDIMIGKQERLIELLAEKRQAIITHAVTKGLDSTAPTKLSSISWLDDIPAHWTVQPLKNLMRMQTGVTLGKDFSEVETETYAYLRVANVQIGYVDLNDVKEIDLPPEVAASSMLQLGDVLMTEGGDRDKLARGCIWGGSINPCVHQNHIFAVRTGPQLLNSFLVLVLDANPARTYFYLTGKQSTNLASTNSTTVKNFRFGVPPISEQLRIVDHIKSKTVQIEELSEKAHAVISTLKERRTALISAAVTGRLDLESSRELS